VTADENVKQTTIFLKSLKHWQHYPNCCTPHAVYGWRS